MTYQPRRSPRSRFLTVRGLRYHALSWGDGEGMPLVMLHGWMDVAASFQFVADALRTERPLVALDWRGFGRSARPAADCYWFPDYLGDLDQALDQLASNGPVLLLGHSMGGNVAMTYAGVRPQRVAGVINVEGFGLRDASPQQAPGRYAQWLDELKAGGSLRDYASAAEVAARLTKTNPRLPAERAQWLATQWAEPGADGHWRILGDPAHRLVNPVLYRWAEIEACWRAITAPVLWIEGRQTDAYRWAGAADELAARRKVVADLQFEVIDEAGHMVHHDQPAAVAARVDNFLSARGL